MRMAVSWHFQIEEAIVFKKRPTVVVLLSLMSLAARVRVCAESVLLIGSLLITTNDKSHC